MKKLAALHEIIRQISGYNDYETISGICLIIDDSDYCNGIDCCDCPFNGSTEMDNTAIELSDQEQVNKLNHHLRQYAHNDGSGLVRGYEREGAEAFVSFLETEISDLKQKVSDLTLANAGLN